MTLIQPDMVARYLEHVRPAHALSVRQDGLDVFEDLLDL